MSDETKPQPLCVRIFPDGSEIIANDVKVTGRKDMDAVVIDVPGFAFLIFDRADATTLSAALHKALKRLA